MLVREHEKEGMKVWLDEEDVEQLLDEVGESGVYRRIAFELAVRCGLRSEEITKITPQDVRDTDVGPVVIVKDGKGDKYRESPCPSALYERVQAVADVREDNDDIPIVQPEGSGKSVSTRSLRYWIETARTSLAKSTGDERWSYVSMHDLRRTWATALADKDVDPLLVLDWGGWEDLETFLDHYRGSYSPEAQRREREKVEWLN